MTISVTFSRFTISDWARVLRDGQIYCSSVINTITIRRETDSIEKSLNINFQYYIHVIHYDVLQPGRRLSVSYRVTRFVALESLSYVSFIRYQYQCYMLLKTFPLALLRPFSRRFSGGVTF